MEVLIIAIFITGYVVIAAENFLHINKAATALIIAALCWTLYICSSETATVNSNLLHHLSQASGILFFLMGAMTIVELIDIHDGFDVITDRISTTSKKKLLWIICCLAFILSAILDNLTTTIVMLSLTRKLISNKDDRLRFAGMIIIAANAGGAWSPIGDVTTTMLWIGGQVTAKNIVLKVFFPALSCLMIPLIIISRGMKGESIRKVIAEKKKTQRERFESNLIFFAGIGALLFVPVFKGLTGLPPFMGMLFALGIIWTLTEIIHHSKEEKDQLSVVSALQKIDTPSILFFLGILLSIGVLESLGTLTLLAGKLSVMFPDTNLLTAIIGFFSAIIDNVPLVAASQGMFSLQQYPTDHHFWEMMAYTTGTGGSILIIGSAAGVVAMGMEKISFTWYLKRFSLLAFAGYIGGLIIYIIQDSMF